MRLLQHSPIAEIQKCSKTKKNPAKMNHLGAELLSVLADSAEDACRAISPFLSASLDELRHFSALLFIVSTVGMETRQGISTEVARLH